MGYVEVVELHVVMPHEELYFDVDFAGRIVFVECVKRERFSEAFTVNASEGLKNTGL